MSNALLILIIILCVYICSLLTKFLEKFIFVEKHYLNTFDKNFVQKMYDEFKTAESKVDWDDYTSAYEEFKKTGSKEAEEAIRKFMEAHAEYKRAKEIYLYIVESNLAILNGRRGIQEVFDKYNDEILDIGKIFKDTENIEKSLKKIKDDRIKK